MTSRNYVDWNSQQEFFPSLFVGFADWPRGWTVERDPATQQYTLCMPKEAFDKPSVITPVQAECNPAISIFQHQTGGVACDHEHLFGMFFRVPEEMRPATQELVELYYDTPMTRHELTLRELDEYRRRIKRLLRMDLPPDRTYRRLQEAFLPLNPRQVWSRLRRAGPKNLLIQPPNLRGQAVPDSLDTMTFGDLQTLIRNEWLSVEAWRPDGFADDSGRITAFFDALRKINLHVLAALVFENSD